MMETKRKLRVDISRLFTAINLMEHELIQHRDKIEALEKEIKNNLTEKKHED